MEPRTRFEKFLAKIAGFNVNISPRTRSEWFLNKIAFRAKDAKELPAYTESEVGHFLNISDDNGTTNPHLEWEPVDEIGYRLAGSGFHFLPDPAATGADAGKVPVAQPDGSYALEEVGGGTKIAFVHLNPAGDEYKVAYETAQQILDMFHANDFLFISVGLDTSHKYGFVYDCQESNGKIDISYSCWQNSTTANDNVYGASPTDFPTFAGFQT